jgi:hypothetical protein
MSGNGFASALAEWVQSVVRDGFTVRAEEGWVRVSRGDDIGTSTGVAEIMGDSREGMASAASAVLNSVQDYVSEELREPWPSLDVPEVAVEDSTLRMWFGERSSPTLAVSDIDLTELR